MRKWPLPSAASTWTWDTPALWMSWALAVMTMLRARLRVSTTLGVSARWSKSGALVSGTELTVMSRS
jgi:hypothetical protein